MPESSIIGAKKMKGMADAPGDPAIRQGHPKE